MEALERNDREVRDEPPAGPVTVIGVGASAGALPALRTFFGEAPDRAGLAYVVVVHLSPEHESRLAELIQPCTTMPVRQVEEDTALEPDHVYVIPPGSNLSAVDTHLRLTPLEERRRERAPIDHFFRTLARTHDGRSMAIVLTGSGSDGTLGLRDVYDRGGITIAQDPEDAEYDGMPRSAIASSRVDLVHPIAGMAAMAAAIAQVEPKLDADGDLPKTEMHALTAFLSTAAGRTGLDASVYESGYILRRVARRMQIARVEELSRYLDLLREDPTEAAALVEDLTVTVASFFREPGVFEELAADVVPDLFEASHAGPIRLWSVGCSTGEDAYSLAILLLEEAGRRPSSPPLRVFATDTHDRSLESARHGEYPTDIETDVSEERLRRFFVRTNRGYRVTQAVRDVVVFARHDLFSDPPLGNLQLISCRHLLGFLRPEVGRDLAALFHYSLDDRGVLVSRPETDVPGDLFRRDDARPWLHVKQASRRYEPRLPAFPRAGRRPTGHARDRSHPQRSYEQAYQRGIESEAPPSLLIRSDDHVAHVGRGAGRYLRHPGGELTSALFRLLRSELRAAARTAVQVARGEGRPVQTPPIAVDFDGTEVSVSVRARPLAWAGLEGLVLVSFHESPDDIPEDVVVGPSKEQLSAFFERDDRYREHLRMSNEELVSMNEELQSTVADLESTRGQLETANAQLQATSAGARKRVDELARVTADLDNLLAATDIATVFLDRGLCILRYNPPVARLFGIRELDEGRRITDLANRVGYTDLADDATRVLRTLVPVEREVAADEGRVFLARMVPYRSRSDRFIGVVLTFVDVTARARAERALRESEEKYRRLVESAREYAIFMIDPEGRIGTWNAGAERVFGYREGEAVGRPAAMLFTPEDREAGVPEDETRRARREGRAMDDRWQVRADGARFWASGVTEVLFDEAGELRGYVKVLRDNTERKQMEEALRRLNETLEARVEERTRELRAEHERARALGSRLTMAEQQERRRLAQVLHDDLQQLLYGVELRMSMLQADLEGTEHAVLAPQMAQARAWVQQAVATTRRLTVDLSPPILPQEGLTEALEWLQRQMRDLHGIETTIEVGEHLVVYDHDVRVLLFQIVRELLFNVKKHAQTTQATVRLERTGDHAVLHVIDSGVGFEVERATADGADGTGLGLASIRERLRLVGGKLVLRSKPGVGTHVEVHCPPRHGSERR